MFSRQTLIALRARRRAYRIAVDFLFPHLDVPPLAQVHDPSERETAPAWWLTNQSNDRRENETWSWIQWMALAVALAIPILFLLAVGFGLMLG